MNDPRGVLPRTLEQIEQGIAGGLHAGAQVYVSIHGEAVADFGTGEARPGVALTADTLMLWLSCSKPIGAVALAQLWEQGRVDLDARVAEYVPEFGTKGKEAVTLRHVLTHTARLRLVESGWPEASWEEMIARVCGTELHPGWPLGEKAAYQPSATWFILAEVIRRVDGRPYEKYVREEIFIPLGMRDSWIGMPVERYRAYGDRIGMMYTSEKGPPRPRPFPEDQEKGVTRCNPPGGAHGPMRELGRFYEMMLGKGELAGARVLLPQTAEAMVARHRANMYDLTMGHIIDWGLGFIVDSKSYSADAAGMDTVPYGFGRYCSSRTFGHGGSQSSISFCDPVRGLVAAVICNGMPGEDRNKQRFRGINAALYEDLGLGAVVSSQ
jgi:CubicO group peptidase (beta-lactamase class C family)